MAWVYVLIAGFFEVMLTLSMKYANGFQNVWPTVATFVSAGAGFLFLGLAVKTIPIGTAYAVWVSMGIVGTTVLGVLGLVKLPIARIGLVLGGGGLVWAIVAAAAALAVLVAYLDPVGNRQHFG